MDDSSDAEDELDIDISDAEDADDAEGFDHPDDVPVTDFNEIPDVETADDAVDGDQDRKAALQQKAKELEEEAEAEEEPDEADDGTPVNLGDDASDGAVEESIEQASDTMFTQEESAEIEEEFGDAFELETIDDIPDDFDYEDQDTSHFGHSGEGDTAKIRHNDVVFELKEPSGAKQDKFWAEIQQGGGASTTQMFDALVRYTVHRPRDIEQRMDEENWTGFAKAGLAMKCSAFLNLDALQDF